MAHQTRSADKSDVLHVSLCFSEGGGSFWNARQQAAVTCVLSEQQLRTVLRGEVA
jgi:hypothetical protein